MNLADAMLHVKRANKTFIDSFSKAVHAPLSLQQITRTLHNVPQQIRSECIRIARATGRGPSPVLIKILVNHSSAQKEITDFILKHKRAPSPIQMKIMVKKADAAAATQSSAS